MNVKIFNFKICAFENFLNLGLILPQATHFPTTRDRVLNISDVLNMLYDYGRVMNMQELLRVKYDTNKFILSE